MPFSIEGKDMAVDTDSGVESGVNPSPVKGEPAQSILTQTCPPLESLPRLPPVPKSKDDLLQQLQSGRRQLGPRDCKLEDWD